MSKEEELRALQEKRKQLDARIRDAQNALRREERKARNHALMVAGGLVMSHAPDGDWKRIDWDALAAWIDRSSNEISGCSADALPTAEAAERLRRWERAKRTEETTAKVTQMDANDDGEAAPDDGNDGDGILVIR